MPRLAGGLEDSWHAGTMEQDLGASRVAVSGAFSVGLGVSALAALPGAGRLVTTGRSLPLQVSIHLAPGRLPCHNDTRMAGLPGYSSSPYVAIVRRGGAAMFVALDTCLADGGGMEVVWDRRLVERRCRTEVVPCDRRAEERRGPSPSSWAWPGLVIVEAPHVAAAPAAPPASPPRILVVEDDPRVREVLHQTLALAGYDVVLTADGEEALAAYAAAPTDLIITDLMMPRKDGVETIQGLRRQHPAAKVIAMTAARGRFNRLTAARHLGAHRTLLKPFGVTDLLTAVRDVLAADVPRQAPRGLSIGG